MNDSEKQYEGWPFEVIRDGEWAGWRRWLGDPFEDLTGPYYWRDEAGGTRCAFRPEAKHMNGAGFMHGGAFMTFADYCLFVFARGALAGSYGVTATLNGEYVGSARIGQLVEGTGEVVRAGGSLVFVRGLIAAGDQALMSFSGVIKKVRPRGAP